MLKFMLDTNICIFTIKNKPASVRERFNLNQGENVYQFGHPDGADIWCRKKARCLNVISAVIEGFVSRIDVLDYDAAAATHSGQIRAELARQGTPCRAI